MFHSKILATGRRVIDFNRASQFMDRELLEQSITAMEHERDTKPRWDATYDAQWVWDYYCGRHFEKYGNYFMPDADPNWDQGLVSGEPR